MSNNVIKFPEKEIENHIDICEKHHDEIIEYLENICELTRSKQGAILLLFDNNERAIFKSIGEVSEKDV